jgi:hypothetical protein
VSDSYLHGHRVLSPACRRVRSRCRSWRGAVVAAAQAEATIALTPIELPVAETGKGAATGRGPTPVCVLELDGVRYWEHAMPNVRPDHRMRSGVSDG